MPIELIRPQRSMEHEFMATVEAFRAVGEHHFVDEPILVEQGFSAYVAWLERGERGELKSDGFVAWSAFWAVEQSAGELVGISSLRHELSPWMAEYGGHIGYRIRPACRRSGVGTQVLSMTLRRAAKRGIAHVLLICESENVASIGVIRNNGGVFEREVALEGRARRRYWVPASDAAI